MHKYIILFFSVSVFLSACGESTPNDVIPQPQMESLLTDVHLTDGELYNIAQTPDSLYKFGTAKYIAVFKKHHTTDKQFKTSLKYYTAHPEKMMAMYDKISLNIKNKMDSLNKTNKTN